MTRRYRDREDGKEGHFTLNRMKWPSRMGSSEVHGGPAVCRASPRVQMDEDRPFLARGWVRAREEGSSPSLEAAEGSGETSQRRGDSSQVLRLSRQGRERQKIGEEGTAPPLPATHISHGARERLGLWGTGELSARIRAQHSDSKGRQMRLQWEVGRSGTQLQGLAFILEMLIRVFEHGSIFILEKSLPLQ